MFNNDNKSYGRFVNITIISFFHDLKDVPVFQIHVHANCKYYTFALVAHCCPITPTVLARLKATLSLFSWRALLLEQHRGTTSIFLLINHLFALSLTFLVVCLSHIGNFLTVKWQFSGGSVSEWQTHDKKSKRKCKQVNN